MNKLSDSYESIELDSKVMGASPVELIQLLFDKCMQQIAMLRTAVVNNDLPAKHKAVNKISSITQYLKDCLNTDEQTQTVSVVQSFERFYRSIDVKLLQISIGNSQADIDHLELAFNNVASAWSVINVK
jgi:flagellar protein FliS